MTTRTSVRTGSVRADRPARHDQLGFIPEVQGLRTLALLLVVIFHIWFGRVSGGVDVFLLVSAFLMTRSLTIRTEQGEHPNLFDTILRRFARLLPLAAAVIILTVIAAWLLMPRHTWSATHGDALASLFYIENWHLIAGQVDYYAGGDASSSLFQHFWSLSVQGQIFLVWPLLHVLGAWVAQRFALPVRGVLTLVFGTVFLTSFAWSLWLTAVDQQTAYFETFARMWEFAAGSLLALAVPWLRLGARARTIAGWLGVLLLVTCGMLLPVDTTFPGVAALWPVVAAALVIVSAGAPTRLGADRLLTRRWFGGVGGYTYALYLVHWPVLVIYRQLAGRDALGLVDGLAIMGIAAGISVVLVHAIERPAARLLRVSPSLRLRSGWRPDARPRESRRARLVPAAVVVVSLAFGSALTGGGEIVRAEAAKAEAEQVAAALSGELATTRPDETLTEASGANTAPGPGAEPTDASTAAATAEDRSPGWDPVTLELGAEAPELPSISDPLPGAGSIEQQWVGRGEQCQTHTTLPGTDGVCIESVSDADQPTALFVGNSHTQQFAAIGYAAEDIAGYPNIRLQAGPGCSFLIGEDAGDDACGQTWRASLDYIAAEHPELVVVLGTMSQPGGPDEPMTGVPGWLADIAEASPETEVVVLRDSPRFEVSPYECALANGWDAPECEHPAPEPVDAEFIAEIEAAGATWVDLNPYICPEDVCRPQVGEVVVWFDDNHLSAAFVHTLTQHFSDAVAASVTAWPREVFARP